MTSRERVLAAIRFETPDQVPLWDSFWGGFPEAWRRHFGLGPDADPERHYSIDIRIAFADETFSPSRRRTLSEEAGVRVHDDGWGRVIRENTSDAVFSQTVDRVLKSPRDLDRLAFEPAELEARYEGFAPAVEDWTRQGLCVFAKVGGIYCRTQFLRGEEDLLLDMASDEGFCRELFSRVAHHRTEMALETLRRGNLWETGLYIDDDMANSLAPMFSPKMFETYLQPLYAEMIATLRRAGCAHVFLHSDGNIGPLLEPMLDAGFEGFNPLEPRCGLDLVALRKRFGTRAVFFGGACNTEILPRGDRREITAHLRPLLELGREGGLVLGQASIGADITPETYEFYVSCIRRHGQYLPRLSREP